jgi:P4 family phage/plasmid primase-like protien
MITNEEAKQKLKEMTGVEITQEKKDDVVYFLKKKEYGQASEILVDEIKKNFYIYTTQDDKSNEMWIYREGIYIPQGRSILKEFLRKIMAEEYNVWLSNQVIAKIEADTQIEPQKFFNNNYVEEVPVNNGILNIITRELSPFEPTKIFFNKLHADYNPSATCTEIEKFLESTLSTADDKLVFYELGGFCLLKEYRYEKAFMFVGNGRNGKDKSLELIKRLLGIENCCAVPLSSLDPDSFIIGEFFGKMANIAGDINNRDLKDTAVFKGLTGRSLQTAPRKFLKPISFINYSKFIFACNELPMVTDISKGFWDRWVLLEFPYTFVTQKEIDETKDKTNLKLRDENIIERITTPEEMSGILNKFLDGLERLSKNKNFSSAKGSEDVKDIWVRKSNSVMSFCFNNVEENSESYITKKEFRKRYSDYCKKFKIMPKSDIVIKRTIEDLFGAVDGNRDVLGNLWERTWEGIAWKN